MSGVAPEVAVFIAGHRVGRLATADKSGAPYVVPVCYAYDRDSGRIYTALDMKPKSVGGSRLKRVRNIRENPNVALVIDDYSEDWGELAYVMALGTATILEAGDERQRAEDLLRQKYEQYAELLEAGCAVIRIAPRRVTGWGRMFAQVGAKTKG